MLWNLNLYKRDGLCLACAIVLQLVRLWNYISFAIFRFWILAYSKIRFVRNFIPAKLTGCAHHALPVSDWWPLTTYKCQKQMRPKITMESLTGAGRLRPRKCRRLLGPQIIMLLLKLAGRLRPFNSRTHRVPQIPIERLWNNIFMFLYHLELEKFIKSRKYLMSILRFCTIFLYKE